MLDIVVNFSQVSNKKRKIIRKKKIIIICKECYIAQCCIKYE